MNNTFGLFFATAVAFSIILSSVFLAYALPGSSGLVGYWKFDEGSGVIAGDSSGNGHTGALVNGPVWTPGGILNGALQFDGIDDFVDLGTWDPHISNELTISAWIKPTSVSCYNGACSSYIVVKGDDAYHSNSYGIAIGSTDSNVNNSHAYMMGSDQYTRQLWAYNSSLKLQPNTWYNIVGVIAGNNILLYQNGVFVNTVALSAPILVSDNHLYIGMQYRADHPYNFNGLIDEVTLWSRTLNNSEIKQVYDEGIGNVAVCGNHVCESGEDLTCPSDCSNFNPADLNGDRIVNSFESTNYTLYYKRQLSWPISPSPIDSFNWVFQRILFKRGGSYNIIGTGCPPNSPNTCWTAA